MGLLFSETGVEADNSQPPLDCDFFNYEVQNMYNVGINFVCGYFVDRWEVRLNGVAIVSVSGSIEEGRLDYWGTGIRQTWTADEICTSVQGGPYTCTPREIQDKNEVFEVLPIGEQE